MPEKTTLIYKISAGESAHAYIGSTVEPARRWKNHKRLLKAGKHTSFLLQRAWNKYGADAFKYEAMLICNDRDRFFYEATLIKTFGEYNLIKSAGMPSAGAMAGLKHTEEGIKNLQAGAKARWAKQRAEKYDPLCEAAWELVKQGLPKYKACKAVGISHSTFWLWISKHGHKEWWNK